MKRKRVLCAMSGGVDSSVAAALLKKQGYEVIGVFMKLWAENRSGLSISLDSARDKSLEVKENICCSAEAATAARAVAQKLKIPFYVLNLQEEFKKAVVDYYISEHESGRTPNPCVICNRDIKGGVLLKKALELEADFLATGHYARIIQNAKINPSTTLGIDGEQSRTIKIQNGNLKCKNFKLLKAHDKTKDQTYFLWMLKQKHLAKLLFPVGDYLKSDVRMMAKKWGLPTAERKESQGICFIPDRDTAGFLRRYAKKLTQNGPIFNLQGKKLGLHNGLINYTIGQRERLGIGGSRAYYVVKLKRNTNMLIVGGDDDLYQRHLMATDLNWLRQKKLPLKVGARIRHGHPIELCYLVKKNQQVTVVFAKPQRAITPGQSIVFYLKEEVLGGGIIN